LVYSPQFPGWNPNNAAKKLDKGYKSDKSDRIEYSDFIWFILAEEDKTNVMSMEYWFKILDQDGDGIVSLFDLQQFYTEQLIKLRSEYI
jgi:Ca2+-binding EF-hand superfamily protein